ncbi:MAG: hypothetical protein EOP04_00030 [Proteobacteria bacterium]|nr:MAG: hypothetical protein EOP04_00030 [Pseudomonadota bacterium]
MKKIALILAVGLIISCARKGSVPLKPLDTQSTSAKFTANIPEIKSQLIPGTLATLDFSENWSLTATEASLLIENKSGSSVRVDRFMTSEIMDLDRLSIATQQEYPDRDYRKVQYPGLRGVRADIFNINGIKQSEIVLLTELNFLIRINSDLRDSANGISEGEKIIESIQSLYRGVPFESRVLKSVMPELSGYSLVKDSPIDGSSTEIDDFDIIFNKNNLLRVKGGNLPRVQLLNFSENSEREFEDLQVDQDGLNFLLPQGTKPVSDLLNDFVPVPPSFIIAPGKSYLLRATYWPEVDLIVKMRARDDGSFSYQKLLFVKKDDLDLQHKLRFDNSNGMSTWYAKQLGVVLFDDKSANPEYPNAIDFGKKSVGNSASIDNQWDVVFKKRCGQATATFGISSADSSTGEVLSKIVDLGSSKLDDFPHPSRVRWSTSNCGVELIKGHKYLVYVFNNKTPLTASSLNPNGSATLYGTISVTDLDPEGEWARIGFSSTIVDGKDLQIWADRSPAEGVKSVTLKLSDATSNLNKFFPALNASGSNGVTDDRGSLGFTGNSLVLDKGEELDLATQIPGVNRRSGFYMVSGALTILDVPTITDIMEGAVLKVIDGRETHASNSHLFKDSITIQEGEMHTVYLENKHQKSIMLVYVQHYIPGQEVTLLIRTMYLADPLYLTP